MILTNTCSLFFVLATVMLVPAEMVARFLHRPMHYSQSTSTRISENEMSIRIPLGNAHPRRPRGSQSGAGEMARQSFQERAEEPLGTKSHRTISKRLREYRLLIGQNNTRDFFCPIRSRYSQSRLEMVR